MALHNYCRLGGLPDTCSRVACDMEDFPELPKLADIFKNCDVPGLEETCYVLFVLLIIPVSAGVFFAVWTVQRGRAKSYPNANPASHSQPSTSSLAPLPNNGVPPASSVGGLELQAHGEGSKPVAV